MADKLGLDNEIKELKLGSSFSDGKPSSFHTIRYDFKPASLDPQKMGSLEIKNNNEVTVTLQNVDGAGTSHTIYRGSQRPYQKECVLVYDRTTGEIVLEKLNHNFQVKKTRMECTQKTAHPIQSLSVADQLQHTKKKFSAKSDNRSNEKKPTLQTHQPSTSSTGAIPKHIALKVPPSNPECGPQKTLPPHPTTPPHSSTSSELSLSGTDKISKTLLSGRKPSARKHIRSQRTKTPALKTTQDKSRNKINFPKTAVKSEKYTQEKNKKNVSVLSLLSESSSSESPSSSESSASKSKTKVKPKPTECRIVEKVGKASPSQSYVENLLKNKLLKEDLHLSDSDSD